MGKGPPWYIALPISLLEWCWDWVQGGSVFFKQLPQSYLADFGHFFCKKRMPHSLPMRRKKQEEQFRDFLKGLTLLIICFNAWSPTFRPSLISSSKRLLCGLCTTTLSINFTFYSWLWCVPKTSFQNGLGVYIHIGCLGSPWCYLVTTEWRKNAIASKFFPISWFFRMSSKVEFFQTRLTQHTLPHLRRSDFQLKALFGANMWYHTTPTSSTTLLLLLGANTSNHQQHYQAMAAKWSQCHFVHRRKGKERDWERFRERKRGK